MNDDYLKQMRHANGLYEDPKQEPITSTACDYLGDVKAQYQNHDIVTQESNHQRWVGKESLYYWLGGILIITISKVVGGGLILGAIGGAALGAIGYIVSQHKESK